jgi:hypothetical protein
LLDHSPPLQLLSADEVYGSSLATAQRNLNVSVQKSLVCLLIPFREFGLLKHNFLTLRTALRGTYDCSVGNQI